MRLIRAAFCSVLLIVVTSGGTSGDCAEEQSPKKTTLHGNLVENQVLDELERTGIKCGIEVGKVPFAYVASVHLGSPASHAGIEENDKIVSIKPQGAQIAVTIERAGHQYQCLVNSTGALTAQAIDNFFKLVARTNGKPENLKNEKPLTASTSPVTEPKYPVIDVTNPKSAAPLVASRDAIVHTPPAKWPIVDVTTPKAPGTKPSIDEVLRKCNIELIIDISGSMNDADGTGDLTKFQWCHQQVQGLSRRLAKLSKKLNITTFNENYTTYKDCAPSEVEQLYADTKPSGNTGLVMPLEDRLQVAYENALASHEPTVIAVITDGMPNVPTDPTVVNRALIRFTRQLKEPDEVRVTFLQIGDGFDGRDFCIDLDQNLVAEGAKFDIVDTKTFPELKQIGLAGAVAEAFRVETDLAAQNAQNDLRRSQAGDRIVKGRVPLEHVAPMVDADAAHRAAEGKIQVIHDERKQLEEELMKQ